MSLYYQYGSGPASMQTPDYQTFLALLEQMRKQNGGDANGGKQSSPNMQGFSQFANKFFGPATPDLSGAIGAAGTNSFDTPTGGLAGIAGLIA